MKLFIFFISTLMTLNLSALEVDLDKSTFSWKGTKLNGEHMGTLKLKSAKIQTKEPKAKTKDKKKAPSHNVIGGEFVMDLNSISVTDLEGKWKAKLEGHLKSEDFFELSKYPTAKLIVSKVTDKEFTGKLTIKDQTHPITVPYSKKGNEYSGSLKFDRTKFNMKYRSGNFFKDLGDKLIHDDVELKFKVVLK
ncbi:MAG: YceI family protein [Bdellovibrionales bacterium]|nr:YceI family protein [Bdellovibrionales bacterium]